MHKLKLEPVTHTYTVGRHNVPGVTNTMQAAGLVDYSALPQDIREAALARGRYVHMATQYYDEGTLDAAALDPRLLPYVDAWAKFRKEMGFVPTCMELKLYSQAYDYAGTLDRIGPFTKAIKTRGPVLLDIKTGKVEPWVAVQTAAYWQLAIENGITVGPERYAVELRKEGKYRLHGPYIDIEDFSTFKAALTLAQWRRTHYK